MACLTGMQPLTHGSIHVYNTSVTDNLDAVRSHIGFCPQTNVIWENLTAREHIEMMSALKGVSVEDNLVLLREVGLQREMDKPADVLSGI